MKTAVFVAVLAATLLVAQAACPNQCSGHGRCGANDKCECYTQEGTAWSERDGWTGADCSLRTCPLGTAWSAISTQGNVLYSFVFEPNGLTNSSMDTFDSKNPEPVLNVITDGAFYKDSSDYDATFVVRVVNYSIFEWKYIDDVTYSNELTMQVDKSAAQELGDSGVRVYWDASAVIYDGYPVDVANLADLRQGDLYTFRVVHQNPTNFNTNDDNSAHQLQECSSRGSCDRTTGECLCMVGYEGEACHRTSCPGNCHGHGVCQAEYRFAADAGSTYNSAWDQDMNMGCLCDAGWRGPDCTQRECPSGADPLGADGGAEGRDCSGRGVCDYTTGQCVCFKGYFGERCETQTNFV